MARGDGDEEAFLLRVMEPELVDLIRRQLREEDPPIGSISLSFPETGREGVLNVAGQPYPVRVLDLPTIVESYKTYDDINLVKTGDVGQMLVVGGPPIPPGQTESIDGVTPPMNKARQRHFRPKSPHATPEAVAAVEDAVHQILNGYAPQGCEFVDVEEIWEVDPATGHGSWQPVSKAREAAAAAAAAAAGAGAGSAGAAANAGAATAAAGGAAAAGQVG